MRQHLLQSEVWLPRPRPEVFAFFSDARNLDRITPSWLRFRVLTPAPIALRRGTLIDYSLRLRGLPVRWRSEITEWQPPSRFVDEQRRGPYRSWRHEHEFEERDGGTLVRDRVSYSVPGGPLEPWLTRRFVRPDLERIFEHRRRVLGELLS